MTKLSRLACVVSMVFLVAASSLHAGVFYPIVDVTVNVPATYPAVNLIEGSGIGFDAGEPHNQLGGAWDDKLWVTDESGASDYFASPEPAPVLVLDLAVDVLLDEISVWEYPVGNDNGISKFSLRFATALDGPSNFGTTIIYNPTFEPIQSYWPRQSFSFSQTLTARYVELTALDNFYDGGSAAGRVGLGEIAFAVPEPSSWTLALMAGVGLGLFFGTRRRDTK